MCTLVTVRVAHSIDRVILGVQQIHQLRDEIQQRGITVGALVNNAGVGYAGWFAKQESGRLESMVDLNCLAPTLLTSFYLSSMVERRRGIVVMISSVSAYQPLPTHAIYAASKAYLSTMALALWEEVREYNVHVLSVEPGTVVTDFAASAGQVCATYYSNHDQHQSQSQSQSRVNRCQYRTSSMVNASPVQCDADVSRLHTMEPVQMRL
jgi:short-subunit dehydrogenase